MKSHKALSLEAIQGLQLQMVLKLSRSKATWIRSTAEWPCDFSLQNHNTTYRGIAIFGFPLYQDNSWRSKLLEAYQWNKTLQHKNRNGENSTPHDHYMYQGKCFWSSWHWFAANTYLFLFCVSSLNFIPITFKRNFSITVLTMIARWQNTVRYVCT